MMEWGQREGWHQQQVLQAIQLGGPTTARDLAKALRLREDDTLRALNQLANRGQLIRQSGGVWRLPDRWGT